MKIHHIVKLIPILRYAQNLKRNKFLQIVTRKRGGRGIFNKSNIVCTRPNIRVKLFNCN